jgi:hypothetical protein
MGPVSPGQGLLTASFARRGSRVQIPSAPPFNYLVVLSESGYDQAKCSKRRFSPVLVSTHVILALLTSLAPHTPHKTGYRMGHLERTDRPKPWRARYRAPDGRKMSKSFRRKADAEKWLLLEEGDVLAGGGTIQSLGPNSSRSIARNG